MEIVPLNAHFESSFWRHVNQDILHYLFFAFDWKYRKSETAILLASEEGRIRGMMLIYDNRIVQLRGSPEAAKAFVEKLDLDRVELQAQKTHKKYILDKYRPIVTHELVLMRLQRGEEKPQIKHKVTQLNVSDADQIAEIMNRANPEFWGEITKEGIAERLSEVNCFGIRVNEEVASICRMRTTDWASHISTVATRETHRNRGYATSLVSHAVKQLLREKDTIAIYVLAENDPAVHVYSKVGFKPYRSYFFMIGDKR
ncbi:MAG: GNAT family N-acetyltransferase [Candidatus Bathyarchaeota archaeon]|nr:MAG: GNAT family N-acetyltransferase [Candidatus Bathyarchaeota archaeon]